MTDRGQRESFTTRVTSFVINIVVIYVYRRYKIRYRTWDVPRVSNFFFKDGILIEYTLHTTCWPWVSENQFLLNVHTRTLPFHKGIPNSERNVNERMIAFGRKEVKLTYRSFSFGNEFTIEVSHYHLLSSTPQLSKRGPLSNYLYQLVQFNEEYLKSISSKQSKIDDQKSFHLH